MPAPLNQESPRHPHYSYDNTDYERWREQLRQHEEEVRNNASASVKTGNVESEPRIKFSHQPRYVQLLVIITFPLYGACRLGLKIVEKSCEYTWKTMKKVVETCGTIYRVCRSVYNVVAPKVWNGLILPFVVKPIDRYVVSPSVWLLRTVFDIMASISITVYNTMSQIFTSVGAVWSSLWR